MYRGKLLILLMLAAALAVGGFGVWYNHKQSYRVIQSFSSRVAALIAYAQKAEVMRLVLHPQAGDTEQPIEVIRVQGRSYWVVEQKNALGLNNFSNVRGWLIHNDNFDWNSPPDQNDAGPWQYGLIFTEGPDQTRLLFNLSRCQMLLLPEGALFSTRPMVAGLQEFFTAQFPEAQSEPQMHGVTEQQIK